jgi:uncharacterized membrane protein
MPRCEGITQKGEQCKNMAMEGSKYCYHHRQFSSQAILASTIGGAMIGSLIAPGVGTVIGGLLGALLGTQAEGEVKK